MNGSQFGFDDDAARPSTPLSSVPADEESTADVASAPRLGFGHINYWDLIQNSKKTKKTKKTKKKKKNKKKWPFKG